MICYERIDISERINSTKSNKSKKYVIFHYWFFSHGFKFQDSACNGCHHLKILYLNISDIPIITIKMIDYPSIIHNISIFEAINLWLYVLLMSRTRFRVIPPSAVAWMSRSSLLEAGAIESSCNHLNLKFKWLQLDSNPVWLKG